MSEEKQEIEIPQEVLEEINETDKMIEEIDDDTMEFDIEW